MLGENCRQQDREQVITLGLFEAGGGLGVCGLECGFYRVRALNCESQALNRLPGLRFSLPGFGILEFRLCSMFVISLRSHTARSPTP